jgi:hypothetical protein
MQWFPWSYLPSSGFRHILSRKNFRFESYRHCVCQENPTFDPDKSGHNTARREVIPGHLIKARPRPHSTGRLVENFEHSKHFLVFHRSLCEVRRRKAGAQVQERQHTREPEGERGWNKVLILIVRKEMTISEIHSSSCFKYEVDHSLKE